MTYQCWGIYKYIFLFPLKKLACKELKHIPFVAHPTKLQSKHPFSVAQHLAILIGIIQNMCKLLYQIRGLFQENNSCHHKFNYWDMATCLLIKYSDSTAPGKTKAIRGCSSMLLCCNWTKSRRHIHLVQGNLLPYLSMWTQLFSNSNEILSHNMCK